MATATVKVVMRSRPNADGTHPLILKILKNRIPTTMGIGQSIHKSDWDKKKRCVKASHPNSARLNNLILKKISEVNNTSLELEVKQSNVTAKEVKETIKPPAETLFFGQAILYLKDLWDGKKYNQYTANRPRIKHFKDFLLDPKKKPTAEEKKKERQENKKLTDAERHEKLARYLKPKDIAFSSITPGLLHRFEIYLKGLGDKNQRTIVNHLAVIRSVFSYADDNRVVDNSTVSPFGKKGVKINFPPSKKIGLSQDEVTSLENVELTDSRYDHVRNIWLFNYYLAGMRIADALSMRWNAISDGRLYYAMGKNDKDDSLKIPAKAQKIIDIYKSQKRAPDDFVFPELKDSPYINDELYLERQINFITSRYDKFLQKYIKKEAGIEKDLTMHISRHSFGNVSGDKIPPQILQKLYRHSRIETTISYQANFIHKEMDEALDAVLGE